MSADTECRQEPQLEVLSGGLSPRAMTLKQRFDSHVIKAEGDGCFTWRGNVRVNDGVGVFTISKGGYGGVWAAARVAFSIENGPLVRFQVIEPFRCGNRKCVRADHWRIVKRTRRAPAHLARYKREDREVAVECALQYGLKEAASALRIKPATLKNWVRKAVRQAREHLAAQRDEMNGANPAPGGTDHV